MVNSFLLALWPANRKTLVGYLFALGSFTQGVSAFARKMPAALALFNARARLTVFVTTSLYLITPIRRPHIENMEI